MFLLDICIYKWKKIWYDLWDLLQNNQEKGDEVGRYNWSNISHELIIIELSDEYGVSIFLVSTLIYFEIFFKKPFSCFLLEMLYVCSNSITMRARNMLFFVKILFCLFHQIYKMGATHSTCSTSHFFFKCYFVTYIKSA